jgi:hypothetical protein
MPHLLAQTLVAASAAIFLFLGTMHLIYTFASRKFSPRDAELESQLKLISPVISRQTTMWRAWIGFNASHSIGAMLFGLLYGYFALTHFDFLVNSLFMSTLGALFIVSFLVLAKLYWFRIPLIGIGTSLVLYVLGLVAARA